MHHTTHRPIHPVAVQGYVPVDQTVVARVPVAAAAAAYAPVDQTLVTPPVRAHAPEPRPASANGSAAKRWGGLGLAGIVALTGFETLRAYAKLNAGVPYATPVAEKVMQTCWIVGDEAACSELSSIFGPELLQERAEIVAAVGAPIEIVARDVDANRADVDLRFDVRHERGTAVVQLDFSGPMHSGSRSWASVEAYEEATRVRYSSGPPQEVIDAIPDL